MNKTGQHISHTGIVTGVTAQNVEVTVEAHSACGSCYARKVCGAGALAEGAGAGDEIRGGVAESKGKVMVVPISNSSSEEEYKVGDKVEVSIEKTMGIKAVLAAYVYPSLVMLFTLLIMLQAGVPETVAGLTALGVIVVWYVGLRLYRKRLDLDIIFKVRKV